MSLLENKDYVLYLLRVRYLQQSQNRLGQHILFSAAEELGNLENNEISADVQRAILEESPPIPSGPTDIFLSHNQRNRSKHNQDDTQLYFQSSNLEHDSTNDVTYNNSDVLSIDNNNNNDNNSNLHSYNRPRASTMPSISRNDIPKSSSQNSISSDENIQTYTLNTNLNMTNKPLSESYSTLNNSNENFITSHNSGESISDSIKQALEDESDIEDELQNAAIQLKFSKSSLGPNQNFDLPLKSFSHYLSTHNNSLPSESSLSSQESQNFSISSSKPKANSNITTQSLTSSENTSSVAKYSSDYQLPSSPIDGSIFSHRDTISDIESAPDVDYITSTIRQSTRLEPNDKLQSNNLKSISKNIKRNSDELKPVSSNKSSSNSVNISKILEKTEIVKPIIVSQLSSLISQKRQQVMNPLENYAPYSGKGEQNPLRLKIYRPTGDHPSVPFHAIMRRDVRIAEVIGFALYTYWKSNLTPALLEEEQDINKWTLRIVEDDGVPDPDFPALDRTRLIYTLGFDEFALVEATEEQAIENEKITPVAKLAKKEQNSSFDSSTLLNSSSSSTTGNSDSSILKIYFDFLHDANTSITMSFPKSTYIADIIKIVCRKKDLDPSRFLLRVLDTRTTVPLDRTVNSLGMHLELELVAKGLAGDLVMAPPNDNPDEPLSLEFIAHGHHGQPSINISRTKTISRTQGRLQPNNRQMPPSVPSATYMKYQVWRRQPMSFISRHERIFAIDGEYIHIMPADDKTFFDTPKTTSLHISMLISCKQSRKVPSHFKLIVLRSDREPKRYDFDAVSATESAEIVQNIRKLAISYRMDHRR